MVLVSNNLQGSLELHAHLNLLMVGDSGAGWYDVAQMLSARPGLRHFRFVLPNAPIQTVTLNFGQKVSRSFVSILCLQLRLYTLKDAFMV